MEPDPDNAGVGNRNADGRFPCGKLFFEMGGNTMKSNTNLRKLSESAIMLALATVLSFFKLYEMPYGGSITIASMLPVLIIAYRYGTKWGLLSGFVFGAIQQLLGLKNLSYFTTWQSVVAIILLDYIIAFMVIGFGGVFKKSQTQPRAFVFGGLLVCLLRFVCHIHDPRDTGSADRRLLHRNEA